jgi:lysophospholipase L1-like esterase
VTLVDNANNAALQANTTATVGTSRCFFTVGVPASSLRLVYINSAVDYIASNDVYDIDGSTTITFKASIEVPGTALIYRVTFNGQDLATLDPGGMIISDPVALDVSAGEGLAVRTYLASGTAYCTKETQNNTPTGAVNPPGFTATTDLTPPGSAAVTGSYTYVYSCSNIIGLPATGAQPVAVALEGDSIGAGSGDGANSGSSNAGASPGIPNASNGGFMVRALEGIGGVLNMAVSGDSAGEFVAQAGHYRRMALVNTCRFAVIEYGVNDVYTGSTVATLQANVLTIATWNKRYGIYKTFLTTITPYTTSSDGWITTTNQAVTSVPNNALRITYNTWVRAGCPIIAGVAVAPGTVGAVLVGASNHPIAAVFDTALTVETPNNGGLWLPAAQIVTDAAITSGSKNVTCATSLPWLNGLMPGTTPNQASVLNDSIGLGLTIVGAGAAGGLLTQVFVQGVNSTSVAYYNGPAASTTVSGATMGIGVTCHDGIHPSTAGHSLMGHAVPIGAFV